MPLKKQLRHDAKEKRRQWVLEQSGAHLKALQDALCARALEFLEKRPGIISGYIPLPHEINIMTLLESLMAGGRTVVLPRCHGAGPLTFHAWDPQDCFVQGEFTQEPGNTGPALDPDILLVPLLAFDSAGNRLGYGKGHYDQTLSALRRQKKCLVLGVAFEMQEAEEIPVDFWDQKLDGIITDQRLLLF